MLPPDLRSYHQAARELHHHTPVVAPYFEWYGNDTLFKPTGGAQCDLEKLDQAGIRTFGIALANGTAVPVAVGPWDQQLCGSTQWALEKARKLFTHAMEQIAQVSRIRIIRKACELAPDPLGAKIGVIPLMTGHAYLTGPKIVDEFFQRGLRISHCAMGDHWCRSCPTGHVNGSIGPVLSDLGKTIIQRMNEVGIVVDVAHMSDESTYEILQISKRPVIDGHTSSRSYVPNCRGHHDWVLREIARKGGVVGIHFADHMYTQDVWGPKYQRPCDTLGKEPPIAAYHRWLLDTYPDPWDRANLRKNRELREKFFRDHPAATPEPAEITTRIATVKHMADHIDYLVHLMGVDHVGLGGDVNGITAHSWPEGVDHVGELPHLTAELLRRGWEEADIRKFLGDNWRRVLSECLPA